MIIIPTPSEPFTTNIPTTREVQCGEDVILTVYDNTSHNIYNGSVSYSIQNKCSITVAFPNGWVHDGLGQFNYILSSGGETISLGIMQVGLSPVEVTSYSFNQNVVSYEE